MRRRGQGLALQGGRARWVIGPYGELELRGMVVKDEGWGGGGKVSPTGSVVRYRLPPASTAPALRDGLEEEVGEWG